jgi:hypothetical protein
MIRNEPLIKLVASRSGRPGAAVDNRNPRDTTVPSKATSRDHDIHKGVMESGSPSATTNAPGLDGDGLPNDPTAIAEDAIGAREDGSQG